MLTWVKGNGHSWMAGIFVVSMKQSVHVETVILGMLRNQAVLVDQSYPASAMSSSWDAQTPVMQGLGRLRCEKQLLQALQSICN